MDTLIIRTGRTGFIMPEKIIRLDAEYIEIQKTVGKDEAQVHTGIETLAQAGAFHLRHLIGFERHAFLLTIDHYRAAVSRPDPGLYHVHGRLTDKSARAFAYDLWAGTRHTPCFEGRFLFALGDYDRNFKKEALETHYRNLLSCLKNDTPAS
ncbi:hypothetical protein JCM14469_37690 [Desulfatiferula olefinivorans]